MKWRYELKYLVDGTIAKSLENLISVYLPAGKNVDANGGYYVLSQYYDGIQLPFYFAKIAGVERRKKVRLRTYGWQFDTSAPWFLELKVKENASISKVRISVSPHSVIVQNPRSWDVIDSDAVCSFIFLRDTINLYPTAQVWYFRKVYESAASDLRITLDSSVRGLYPGETMSRKFLYDRQRAIVADSYVILEVKVTQTIPHWLMKMIQYAKLSPQAISKYVGAMNALQLSRKLVATC